MLSIPGIDQCKDFVALVNRIKLTKKIAREIREAQAAVQTYTWMIFHIWSVVASVGWVSSTFLENRAGFTDHCMLHCGSFWPREVEADICNAKASSSLRTCAWFNVKLFQPTNFSFDNSHLNPITRNVLRSVVAPFERSSIYTRTLARRRQRQECLCGFFRRHAWSGSCIKFLLLHNTWLCACIKEISELW